LTDTDQAATTPERMVELTERAQHAQRRYELYRAKVYGPRLSSPGRLHELERASTLARSALERAERAGG
jgi:hypothetical protein